MFFPLNHLSTSTFIVKLCLQMKLGLVVVLSSKYLLSLISTDLVDHSGQREVLTVAWPHGCAQGPARRLINEEIFVLWIMRGAALSQKLGFTSLVFVPPRLTDCLVAGPGSRLAVRRWAGLGWWTEQSRISINYHCYQQSPSSTTSLLAGDRWGFLLALRRYD